MQHSFLAGVALVLAGGVFQGSFMFPSKWMKGWAWENYWIIFAFIAYLVSPWVLARITVLHLAQVYAGVSLHTMGVIFICGLAWGIGALTFGLGVDAVGMALGFAIILGIAAAAGALLPVIVNPPAHMTAAYSVLLAVAIVIMLAGVAACSMAGGWKERQKLEKRSYKSGIAICIASGLLSACGNLGFVFGAEVASRAQSLGTPSQFAGNAVWTLLAMPLFVCNAGYSLFLLLRNKTGRNYLTRGSGARIVYGLIMGGMWMAGMSLYGAGARLMGNMGASVGWGMLMSTIVLTANLLGLVSGEWSGAPSASRRMLSFALSLLLVAIAALAYSNSLLI